MACGNNKATRSMVVSMGGLVAVAAAVDAAPSKQAALKQLMARQAGPAALSGARVRRDLAERRDHYLLPQGEERLEKTGREGRKSHVHVGEGIDLDPKAVLVQQTERLGKRTVRREGILFLNGPSEARIVEAEQALARTLRKPKKRG